MAGGRFRVTFTPSSAESLFFLPLPIDELELVAVGICKNERCAEDGSLPRGRRDEGDFLPLLVDQPGRGDLLVEVKAERQLRPLHGRHVPNVLGDLGLDRRIGRVDELRVGPHQLGVLEDAYSVGRAALPRELDVIGQVIDDRFDTPGERRIFQAPGHRVRG